MTFEPRFVELSLKAHILHCYPLLPHYTWRKLRQRRANCITESTGLVTCSVGGRSYIFKSPRRSSELVCQVVVWAGLTPPWLPSHTFEVGAHVACLRFKYNSCYCQEWAVNALGVLIKLYTFSISVFWCLDQWWKCFLKMYFRKSFLDDRAVTFRDGEAYRSNFLNDDSVPPTPHLLCKLQDAVIFKKVIMRIWSITTVLDP